MSRNDRGHLWGEDAHANFPALAAAALMAWPWGYFLTLTFKRREHRARWVERLVSRALARRFRGRSWLWCIERHRDGSFHVHVLIDRRAPLTAVQSFVFWWGTDNRAARLRGRAFRDALRYGIADLRVIPPYQRDLTRTVVYVTKYCLKQRDAVWGCNLRRQSATIRLSSRDDPSLSGVAGLLARQVEEHTG